MASVAAYRAALLWQASAKTPQDRGAYDAARRAVELALEMDPAPGRVRLLAGELAARQGDSARLRELLVDRVRGDSIDMYRYEWVLANAVAGDAVPPDRLNRAWGGPQSSHWQLLLSIVLAVRLGDAGQLDACKELLAGLYEGYRWDVHYYWMARAMIEGPGDDPERALEWLAEVQEAEPAGWFLPVELLRLRARAAAGDAVPSGAIEEAIDREIGELEESATTELHALFMLHEARRDAAALGVRDPDPR
jgi:tetratricopeptide (TPR) repeat protein